MEMLSSFLQHENEINSAEESQRITYGNSDDEDLAGSGEIEGSAGEVDYRLNTGNHRNTDGKARKSLILWSRDFKKKS